MKRLFLLLLLTGLLTNAAISQDVKYNKNYHLYSYRFEYNGMTRGFNVWIPSDDTTEVIRGLFINGNPGTSDNTGWVLNSQMQEYAKQFHFGLCATQNVSGSSTYNFYGGKLLDALEKWADMGMNPELRNVPWCVTGNSSAGAFTYGLAMFAPERTICFGANVPATLNPREPSDEGLRVPGIFICGEVDHTVGNLEQSTIGDRMTLNRPKGALWSKIEVQGMGHEHRRTMHIFYPFFEKCIALRLPVDANPRLGPVALNPVSEDSGWIALDTTWTSGFTEIHPIDSVEFPRDPNSSWCLDKDMAFLDRAYTSRNEKFQINTPDTVSWEIAPVQNTDMITYDLEKDTSIRILGNMYTEFNWDKIEVYLMSEKIGEVHGGADEFEFDYKIKHLINKVCDPFTAIAYDAEGNVISPAQMFSVLVFGGNFYSADSIPSAAPDAPQLATEIGYRSVKVNWNVPQDNDGIWGYHVYFEGTRQNEDPVVDTFFIVKNLQVGSAYKFSVKARDIGGNYSELSEESVISTAKPVDFTYLSDLDNTLSVNGSGPVEHDMTNGGSEPKDGIPIVASHIYFPKGLGVSSVSEISWNLNGMYDYFASDLGLLSGSYGIFSIIADGDTLLTSPPVRKTTGRRAVFLNIGGVDELKLVVTGLADDAVWAGAAVMKSNFTDTEIPPAPYKLAASSVGETTLSLSWSIPDDDTYIKSFLIYINDVVTDTAFINEVGLSGLSRGTDYDLKVAAIDLAGHISDFSNVVHVTMSGNVGIDQNSVYNLKVYPIPANDIIFLEGVSIKRLVLTNLSGQNVKLVEGDAINKVNISDLKDGIYILRLVTDTDHILYKKLVIER